MVIRASEQQVTVKERMREGNGKVELRALLQPEQFCGHGRLFSIITLEPGCSIGWHVHEGESETFYILQGTGKLNDNGQEVILNPGDCSYTASGEGHSIGNIGQDTLKIVALIVNA